MPELKSWVAERREQVTFAALVAAMTVVYLWGISRNGWSNEFYAAAVQASSQSWKAWFFGSFDPQNYVTVDKPAGGLWLMGLSARIFGFSSASMLIPHALLAVGSAVLIRATVRRQAGSAAGLLALAVFALVPVVSVMFRHCNPDAPMIFGMVVAAYFTVRALDSQSSRHAAGAMALAGVGIGFAFLCKTLEALLVAPALMFTYVLAARFGWKAKIAHLAAATGALVVSSGWWLLAVALTPAASRPYVDNSTDNSEWTLAVGYNGLDRILGKQSHGGGREGPGFSGTPGLFRLFEDDQAFHAAWLIPAALILLILGLTVTSRVGVAGTGWIDRVRTRVRSLVRNPAGVALILWGGWLVSIYLILTYMKQQFHPYYTSALAPGIAGTFAVGSIVLWHTRSEPIGRYGLAATTLAATVTAWVLLRRIPQWQPWLRWALLAGGLVAATLLVLRGLERSTLLRNITVAAALTASLGGSLAFTIANVTTPKTGGLSASGPAMPDDDMFGGRNPQPLDPELVTLIKGSHAKWPVATTSTHTAAPIQLETNTAVMAIGGFSGRDNPITLQQFIDYTRAGTVQFYAESTKDQDRQEKPPPPDSDTKRVADEIQQWVHDNFSAKTYGDYGVYDLSAPPQDQTTKN